MHRIDSVDEFIKFTLCFPQPNCEDLEYRIEILLNNGFTHFVEYGKKFLEYRIIGKGYSSISVLAINRSHGLGLIKIRRIDSRRKTLEHEGLIIDYLEKTSFVPKIYFWCREFVFMEYLDSCKPLDALVKEWWITRDLSKLVYLFRRVINALYLFDLLGVDHSELNRPYGHIYLCDNVVKVIDWESSHLSNKPHNLTSFLSYILHRSTMSSYFERLMNNELRNYYITLLKNYKNSRKTFFVREITKFLEQLLYQHF